MIYALISNEKCDAFETTRRDFPLSEYLPIAEATNGSYFYVYDNFNEIIDEIGLLVSNTYVIRYKTSKTGMNCPTYKAGHAGNYLLNLLSLNPESILFRTGN